MRVLRRHDDVTMIGLSKETERGTAGYCNRYRSGTVLLMIGCLCDAVVEDRIKVVILKVGT